MSHMPINHYYSMKSGLKKGNPDFGVTMGSFDEEEKYDLVGLYLLDSKKEV